MSEAKHTPGPWLVDAENSGLFEQDRARFWINADGMHIAYVDGPRNAERTANARLIAAAPELLEYLQYAVWAHPELEKNEKLMAVIAKATAHKEGQ